MAWHDTGQFETTLPPGGVFPIAKRIVGFGGRSLARTDVRVSRKRGG